jgi:MurNAc alpha-1-phosphate uridylyltransferase
MKAIIFSAGLGTRFKPWTDKHPKALAVVNGKSLLQRNIEYLQQYGIADIIINVHHFGEQIISAIEHNGGWGSRIQISNETNALLETGGGLLKAKELFQPGEPFLSCNVDILTDLDIQQLISIHKKEKALVTFGVMDRVTSRYLLFDTHDRLCGWRNTRTKEEIIARPADVLVQKAYSCVAVFQYGIFDLMAEKGFTGKFSLIDVYLSLAENHLIRGYDHTGDRFVDVGKPESVEAASRIFPE